MVFAFIAERGPVARSDIWQKLHDRVSVGHVDRSLQSLLASGRICVAKAELAKPVDGPWNPRKIVRYTASVYSVARHDG